MILMTREMNSSANTFRLNICFIRPSRVPIQESIISRFCFSFSYAYVSLAWVREGDLPPRTRVFFPRIVDFRSFPARKVHEILVQSTAYNRYIPRIDRDKQPSATYHRNVTIRTLHTSSSNVSPCTTASRNAYDILIVNSPSLERCGVRGFTRHYTIRFSTCNKIIHYSLSLNLTCQIQPSLFLGGAFCKDSLCNGMRSQRPLLFGFQ